MFAAYRDKNRKVVEDTLADDFRFTSPWDDAIDKATYFERCWPVSERIESNEVERIFVQGDEAFVTYRVRNRNEEFRNTEFFVLRRRPDQRASMSISAPRIATASSSGRNRSDPCRSSTGACSWPARLPL